MMNPKTQLRFVLIFLVSLAMLTGCGSSSSNKKDTNNSNPPTQVDSGSENNNTAQNGSTEEEESTQTVTKTKGYLIDSPLEGVSYICGDGAEGITDSEGMFECAEAPVVFKIGNLTLGTLTAFTADGKVYPQDLLGLARDNYTDSRLKLLARLLQSLDDDGKIDTKITITADIRTKFTTEQDFKDMSKSDIEALLSGVGKSLSNECGALKHLGDSSVECESDGSYVVVSSGWGGSGFSSGGTSTQKTTITGYAEDDPMPNAKIKVTDEADNVVAQAIADANGKYTLQANFTNGKIYTLESKGKLGDRNITLHSIFKFSSDTVINANPITELKYQLVQSGKTIEDAEALIRDYFSVVSGEKLERNRFDVDGSLALGMVDLAKLYDGTLPVDAIEKIKEDILRNDALAVEDREYSFRDLLQLKLELIASSDSLKVGESVTVTLLGADDLNEKYLIEWVAVPNDNGESSLTKTFTVQEPKDVFVSVNLYLKDDENSSNNILISTVSSKVNFYKVEEPQNIVISDGDTNVSIGSDVKINIPANALGAGQQISYSEVTTGSNDYLKVFNLEPSGTVFSEPMEIRVKYDPSQVYDPRLLTIKRVSSDGKEEILKVKEIDYANSELIFETEHFSVFTVEYPFSFTAFGKKYSYGFAGANSFEKWDEKGSTTTSVNGISVKKLSPYHYLMESLNFYCEKRNSDNNNNNDIDNGQCQRWLRYFQNKDNARKIKYSYKNFFNIGKNYQNFENDYFTWELIKQDYDFPGVNNNSVKNLEYIINSMFYSSLEGEKRSITVFNNIGFGIDISKLAYLPDDLPSYNNSANHMVNYVGNSLSIFYDINMVAGTVSSLYEEISNSKYQKASYIKTKKIFEFLFNVVLGKLPIDGHIYSTVLGYGLKQLDSFDSNHFRLIAMGTLANDQYNFNKYLSYLFHGSNSSLHTYSIDTATLILKEDNKILSKESYGDMLSNILTTVRWGINDDTAGKSLGEIYIALKYYHKLTSLSTDKHKNKDYHYKNEVLNYTLLRGATVALFILDRANKVNANDLISTKQAKIDKIWMNKLKREEQNKLQKRSFQKQETTESKIVTIPVLDSFDKFLEQIKINIPESKWDSIEIQKVSLSIDKYAIDSEASTDTTMMTFKMTEFEGNSLFSKSNIAKDSFTLANEKYSQSLASIFADTELDSSDFQGSFVVVKANILIKLNGVERVVSKEYQFINYLDSDDELITDPEYGKLTSAIRDAVSSEAIADARITLLPIDITNNTDENGNYSFSKLPPNTYDVKVSKEGYKTVTIYDVTLADGEVKNIEVLLAIDDAHAENNGTATITLKNAINAETITGGYIKVREGQNSKIGDVIKEITNGGDNFDLNLVPNTYTVEVGANGYSKAYNTITIVGDTNRDYEFSITPILSEGQVRIVLSWGETPSDLDSHLVKKTNDVEDYHIYYSSYNINKGENPENKTPEGDYLDTDKTDGKGPETITISNLNSTFTYKYYVHNYSNGSNHNDETLKTSGAKIEVYYNGKMEPFYIPNENGNAWKVFEIVNGEIVPCTSECVFGVDGENDVNIGLRKLERSSLDKRYFRNLSKK